MLKAVLFCAEDEPYCTVTSTILLKVIEAVSVRNIIAFRNGEP